MFALKGDVGGLQLDKDETPASRVAEQEDEIGDN